MVAINIRMLGIGIALARFDLFSQLTFLPHWPETQRQEIPE
jgi:hypothetical protein